LITGEYQVKRFRLALITLLIASSFITAQKSMEERHFEYGKKLFDEQFYSLAALQFQNYLEQFPSGPHTADALFMMGKAWFLGKDFENAQKAWLQFVIQFPSHDRCAEGHYGIAESYEKMGNLESAITGFERIITYFPGHEKALHGLYRAAQLAVRIHDYKLGESIINRLLIEKLPLELRSQSQFLLAALYTEQNRFEKAMDVLKPFTDSGIRPEDRDQARFELAWNHQMMGHFEACQPLYRQVIQSASDDSLKQAARFELATTLFSLNQLTQASTLVQAILGSAIRIPAAPVYKLNGAILMAEHRPEEAISSLEKAVVNMFPESPDLNWSLLQAYRAAGRYRSLVERTSEWLEKRLIPESVKKRLLLIRADAFLAQGQDQESMKCYRDYIDLFPQDSLVPLIKMKQADNYFHQGIAPVGRSVLREIWERVPGSETGLTALERYAESLESEGDWQGARQIRQIESEQYPAGPLYQSGPMGTSEKVTINYTEMRRMHSLLSRTIQQPDSPGYAFEYGRYLVEDMLLYEEAIPYLHNAFASDAYPSSAYFLGLAYFQISKRHSQQAFRDSALAYLMRLEPLPVDDKIKTDALILLYMVSDEDELVRIGKLKHALGEISSSEQQDRLRKIITAYYFRADSLALAEQIVSDWLSVSPDGGMDARFYAAQLYLKGNRVQKADSMLAGIQDAPPFYHSRILFERAKIAYQQNESSAALKYFQEVRNRYPYLSCADTSQFFIAQLYLIKHQYKEAAEQFLRIIERDSLNRCAYETGLISHPPQREVGALIGLAKAFEGLENYEKARQLYNRAHSIAFFENEDFAIQMARISEKQGFIVRAIDYLEQAMKDPTDSLFLWVGRLYEKSGQHDKAYELYQNALKKTKDADLQMVFNQKIIITLLRQDRIPEAEARINVFEQSFKKTNAFESNMAEIWLETGKAQYRLKNFSLAEECFKRVRDKFRKTSFRAQAQLEIGRTYIITNKTEEALDILTKMADEYRGDRIYYTVYLNLGDLYFRQQQLDHALAAFKTVLDDESSQDNRQLATRYLIRIYEAMGLYEAALAITKSYIQQFPEADDILLKRVQIGNYYMRLNDYYRAIDQFQQVQLEADPELEAEIQYWIGKSYAEMGQSERAILEYLRVKYISKPTKLPWASTAMYEAAMLYFKMNKSWEARTIFEKIVRYEGATSDLGRVAKQRIDEIDGKLAGKADN
jgi:tetratricopeptide (TPR) repeat protein